MLQVGRHNYTKHTDGRANLEVLVCLLLSWYVTIITEGTIYFNSRPFLIKTQVALNNPGEVDSTIFNANIMKTRDPLIAERKKDIGNIVCIYIT